MKYILLVCVWLQPLETSVYTLQVISYNGTDNQVTKKDDKKQTNHNTSKLTLVKNVQKTPEKLTTVICSNCSHECTYNCAQVWSNLPNRAQHSYAPVPATVTLNTHKMLF